MSSKQRKETGLRKYRISQILDEKNQQEIKEQLELQKLLREMRENADHSPVRNGQS